MTEQELIGKIHSSVYQQCQKRGYATPVDVLMDIGVLSKENYEKWRFGKVPYLEKVCTVNLRKLGLVLRQIKSYAKKSGYEESYTFYKQWGTKNGQRKNPLQFSKSGSPVVEKAYSTHYLDRNRIADLKHEEKGTVDNEQ